MADVDLDTVEALLEGKEVKKDSKQEENNSSSRGKDDKKDRDRDDKDDKKRKKGDDRDKGEEKRRRSHSPKEKRRSSRSPPRHSSRWSERDDRERSDRRDRDRDDRRDRDRDDRRDRDRDDRRDREVDFDRRRDYREYRYRERDRERGDFRKKIETPEEEEGRESRTVYANNLPIRATEKQLLEFFQKAGPVRDIRLITDRNTGKSKGFGYIEYVKRESLDQALRLSGSQFMNYSVNVQATQHEKNKAAAAATPSGAAAAVPTRLYVSNLHPSVTEDDLRTIFAHYGELASILFQKDKSTAGIQFKYADDLKRAMANASLLELKGRPLIISQTLDINNPGLLDELDDEGGGIMLNAASRAMIMQKLRRSESDLEGNPKASAPEPVAAKPAPRPVASQPPTQCLLLTNMFDPTTETSENFHLDIQQDVHEECSKFGEVRHIFVDKDSKGDIYLKFESILAAQKAVGVLNGRWFAGKQVSATYMDPRQYHAKFPRS